MRRRQRYFAETDKETLLTEIEKCRNACIAAMTAAPIGGPVYRAAGEVQESIDKLAEVLTGDRTHFHLKSGPVHR